MTNKRRGSTLFYRAAWHHGGCVLCPLCDSRTIGAVQVTATPRAHHHFWGSQVPVQGGGPHEGRRHRRHRWAHGVLCPRPRHPSPQLPSSPPGQAAAPTSPDSPAPNSTVPTPPVLHQPWAAPHLSDVSRLCSVPPTRWLAQQDLTQCCVPGSNK